VSILVPNFGFYQVLWNSGIPEKTDILSVFYIIQNMGTRVDLMKSRFRGGYWPAGQESVE
jgi:hypothetical protein